MPSTRTASSIPGSCFRSQQELLLQWLLYARLVSARIVDLRMHLDRLKQFVTSRLQRLLSRTHIRPLAVEPGLVLLRRQHDRHAVMQARNGRLCIAGDDGDRVDLAAVSVPPALPNAAIAISPPWCGRNKNGRRAPLDPVHS